ncbi:MAG: hypothetical protein AVDCRST_MAG90-1808 [uncultured Microvirga sp.]|uniref:GAF domain-containing protein n=1 Tax=uncultured Microvirga sp. TaxID=412392 RepID=A0A6J4LN56_9HYPH|nr:MAG: hypothetical protein AVDCRST_MAG90-1808 [uncultured Microvirga sp.]
MTMPTRRSALALTLGGRKRKRGAARGRRVLIGRRILVGEGEAAIRAAFDDHALILGLGLRAAINIPVVFGGACLGTLNALTRRDRVAPGETALCRHLAHLAIPALLAARTAPFDRR